MTYRLPHSEISRSHLPLDDFERGILAVTRGFFLSFAEPERHTWQIAFRIAEERWGEPLGLAAANLAAKLVHAVVRTHEKPFDFYDPQDAILRDQITQDEAYLLTMIHHMRRDQTAPARAALEALTNGRMDPDVIRAGLGLATRFSKGAATGAAPSRKPTLRIIG